MIPTTLDELTRQVDGTLRGGDASRVVRRVVTDSRGASPECLFAALPGEHTDGHRFLADAAANGAAAALVSAAVIEQVKVPAGLPLVVVESPLRALQRLAAWHRREAIGQVVAITGSNGKTTVKDALATLLSERQLLASPGSYNSQLGLPLSILSAEAPVPLAILEAGISAPGEMATLEEIARPDLGILTNIGLAHFAAFGSREAIAREKLKLFERVPATGWVLVPGDEPLLPPLLPALAGTTHAIRADGPILSMIPGALVDGGQLVELAEVGGGRSWHLRIGTRSAEIIDDLRLAASAALLLGVELERIAETLDGYVPAPTRMEFWSSPEGVRIINDAYSADPISVRTALRSAALSAASGGRKIFVFGGMREMGAATEKEYRQVGANAAECGFSHVLLLGDGDRPAIADGYQAGRPDGVVVRCAHAAELKEQLLPLLRAGDTVLFKGPRNAGLVRTVEDITGAIAQRCLWVDLGAIAGNIARFRRHCGGRPKVLAMLKALAYGTDLVHLAFWMSRLGIHHIGVSSTAEGMAVRKTGVSQDIYVFLSDREDVDNLVRYRLTPVIYSDELATTFARALAGRGVTLDVHLKVDTGMHRLGVDPSIALAVARRVRDSGVMRLTGLCTHFASADDPAADDDTRAQIALFDRVIAELRADGFDELQVHAANTAATARFPEAHYDMVRVGIGLYGIYPSPDIGDSMHLALAIAATSRIATVYQHRAGARLGYHGTFRATRDMRVGIVPFGYDDGLPWRLSGAGEVLVEGRKAPIVGRVSMDQLQIDLTDLPDIGAGAEVLLYGAHAGHVLRPEDVAARAGTITHELLTRVGRRVHRIFREP